MYGRIPLQFADQTPMSSLQEWVWGTDPDAYTTTQKFTYTKTGSPTLTNPLYPTPGTLLVPGRPCHGVAYAAANTEGECIQSTASYIAQRGQSIYIWGGFSMTTMASGSEFLMGMQTINTTPLASDGNDIIQLYKTQANAFPQIKFRNGGGTAETANVPLVMVDGSWYDFMIKIDKDRDQADGKKGSIQVFYAKDALPGSPMQSLGTWSTLTQFPTTVTAFTCSVRPYTSGKTVYLSHFGYAVKQW